MWVKKVFRMKNNYATIRYKYERIISDMNTGSLKKSFSRKLPCS